jgi:hypothetical protein
MGKMCLIMDYQITERWHGYGKEMAYHGNSCKERVFAVRKKSNNIREEQNES